MKPVELFIHFDDADAAKIVFFGNYYRLAHRAMELSLPQWGLKWDDFFRRPGIGFPVRHTEAEYFQPIRPGHPMFITVYPEKIGESSVTFRSEFREKCEPNAPLSAVVRVVHVSVDIESRQKAKLPESLASALRTFLSPA